MAKSKLVLIAAVGAVEGPWINVNGQKAMDVVVRGLSHDESIMLEYYMRGGDVLRRYAVLQDGVDRIETKDWKRYRACKVTPSGVGSTFVEVFPNGDV